METHSPTKPIDRVWLTSAKYHRELWLEYHTQAREDLRPQPTRLRRIVHGFPWHTLTRTLSLSLSLSFFVLPMYILLLSTTRSPHRNYLWLDSLMIACIERNSISRCVELYLVRTSMNREDTKRPTKLAEAMSLISIRAVYPLENSIRNGRRIRNGLYEPIIR